MLTSADNLTAPSISDCSADPFKALLVRVIGQAIEDRGQSRWQRDADRFFAGPAFARYCLLLGWNQEWVSRRLI
jgi:hypothetical protein